MNKRTLIDPGQHWHKDNLGDEDYIEVPGIDYPNYDEHSEDKTTYNELNWKPLTYDSSAQPWDEDTEIPF